MGPRFRIRLESYVLVFLNAVFSCLGYAMQEIDPSSNESYEILKASYLQYKLLIETNQSTCLMAAEEQKHRDGGKEYMKIVYALICTNCFLV
jgi:hypothetical protein